MWSNCGRLVKHIWLDTGQNPVNNTESGSSRPKIARSGFFIIFISFCEITLIIYWYSYIMESENKKRNNNASKQQIIEIVITAKTAIISYQQNKRIVIYNIIEVIKKHSKHNTFNIEHLNSPFSLFWKWILILQAKKIRIHNTARVYII